MKKPGILLLNLLIMVGYSVLFTLIGMIVGDDVIGIQWGVLAIHIIALFILGLVNLSNAGKRKEGGQLLLAALLVAIIGHGLCFFNGLMNMGNIH
jgi:drug/metabolite transporter (DMT)-like permease